MILKYERDKKMKLSREQIQKLTEKSFKKYEKKEFKNDEVKDIYYSTENKDSIKTSPDEILRLLNF